MVQRSTSPTTAVFTASTQVVRRDPSEFQYVKLTIDKNVARITLSRPDHNLLNESMLQQEGSLTTKFLQSLVTMEKSLPAFIKGEPVRNSGERQAALRHIAALP